MRIAHLSDLHILDLEGVPAWRLANKRFTGWLNLKLHRGSVHKREVVEALLDDLRAHGADHVVITGDVTNLALEPEFDRARAVLARLGFAPEQVSLVPGNHDVYTRGAQRAQRFARVFAAHLTSDLAQDLAGAHPSGPFPYVRLRGPAALIGLSTAVARLPLVSSGRAGAAQRDALARILAHPEVRARTAVVLLHHPVVNPRKLRPRVLRGLAEARELRAVLATHPRAVVLHGHLHERSHRVLPTDSGAVIHHLGATSASLIHSDADRVAGYNVYELGPEGLGAVRARVYNPSARLVVDGVVPQADPNGTR